MAGIKVRHATARSTMVLVPIMSKPLNAKPTDLCPGCKAMFASDVVHPVKTVHLWLDDTGACIVSDGVLELLREAGMPELTTENEVANPPTLTIGDGADTRQVQDYKNRTIVHRW